LGVIASCRRGLLGDTTETAAYVGGKEVAIVALAAAMPGHRLDFLKRLDQMPYDDLELLFRVVTTSEPHQTFTDFIKENITDTALNGRYQTHLLWILY
jgi:hypothetical protein